MKKIFTLIAVAAMAITANAQTTIFWDGFDADNEVTFQDGYKIKITGNESKTLSGGSNITVDGTSLKTIKLSNGAENTLYAPAGKAVAAITLYAYINIKTSATTVRDSYWANVDGVDYTYEQTPVKSCNQTAFDDGKTAADYGLVGLDEPAKHDFKLAAPKTEVTFKNAGEQLGFVLVVTEGSSEAGITNVKDVVLNTQAYNLAGQKVGANYKGVVLMNGKKMLMK